MIGDVLGFIRRNLWYLLIIFIIAPTAAGIVVNAILHDWSTFTHVVHVHLPTSVNRP